MKISFSNGVITIDLEEMSTIMATLAEIQAAIADLQATGQAVEDGLDQVVVKVQTLKDQVAQGGGVSEADLDSLMTQLQAAKQPLTDSLQKEAGL